MKIICIQLNDKPAASISEAVSRYQVRISVDDKATIQRQEDSLNIFSESGEVVGSFRYANVLGWWIEATA